MQPNTSMDPSARSCIDPGVIRPTQPSTPSSPPQPFEVEVGNQMASMAIHELGPMLTASEVAELLHLHVNTVKRLGDRGELPFYRVCKRGDRRFRLDDVLSYLATNR
jgi:excisionase family DNA binding protein